MGDEGIATLIGEAIINIEGLKEQNNEIIFTCLSGKYVKMYHEQDCCESVYLADVIGDADDLLYSKVITAELATSEGKEEEDYGDHVTWSFYKIGTENGEVTLRWCGTSNGYYSETVDVETHYRHPQ